MKSRPTFACGLLVPLILGCSALALPGVDGQETTRPKTMLQNGDRIITFGDSVTRLGFCPAAPNCNFKGDGWATMLKRDLEAEGLTPEIISAGVGGDTSVDLLARADRDVIQKKPTVVTLMVGLNDTWRYSREDALNPQNKGSIAPPEYEANLREIVGRIQKSGARLILCTPSLLGEDPRRFDDPKDGMNVRLNAYAESVRRIAAENKIQLLDVRRAFIEKERQMNTTHANSGVLTIADGVHLNETGQRFLADLMLSALQVQITASP